MLKVARLFVFLALFVSLPAVVSAQDYRLEKTDAAAPEELPADVAKLLAPGSYKVIKGKTRVASEIWIAKEWDVTQDFTPSGTILYPFKPGDFIGVIRFKNKGSDFRGQTIPPGVYVLRYAQQPVDGNHAGTNPTRDFLLLVKPEDDKGVKNIEVKALNKLSSKSIDTPHPAMFCLSRMEGKSDALPALTHDEKHDRWNLRFQGTGLAGDKKSPLVVELVVIGKAME